MLTLGYPWQELGYVIDFVPHTGGLLGLADPTSRTITVFVKPRQSVQSLRVVLAHEIGHALDDRTGTDVRRARYLEPRGIAPGTPRFPCPGCHDVASPAGDFAEVFAAWLVGPTHFRSLLAPLPDAARLPPSRGRARPARADCSTACCRDDRYVASS